MKSLRNNTAATLVELLVSLLVISSLFASASSAFLNFTRQATDHEIMSRTQEEARNVLDLLAYELRMTGAGMPIKQTNFLIGAVDLEDAPLPLLTTAAADLVQIRLNENGKNTVLAADYTPTIFDLEITVLSAAGFAEDDIIYISDMQAGGANGLRGIITNIAGNLITIDSDFLASAGATFPAGSAVNRVVEVTYDSPGDWSGITRNNGVDTIVLAPNSTFILDYLDEAGASMTLPLGEADIASTLRGIRITVSVRSSRPLRSGETYTSEMEQLITLRNLTLNT